VRVDPKEGFAESNETCNVQDRIRREMVKLHAIHKKQPTKEFMGRKRKTMEEKSKKHHSSRISRATDKGIDNRAHYLSTPEAR
jgi:hypothetical protein